METQGRFTRSLIGDVNQPQGGPGWHTASPTHRRRQHRMLPAITFQVARHLASSGKTYRTRRAHALVNKQLNTQCPSPSIFLITYGFGSQNCDLGIGGVDIEI